MVKVSKLISAFPKDLLVQMLVRTVLYVNVLESKTSDSIKLRCRIDFPISIRKFKSVAMLA